MNKNLFKSILSISNTNYIILNNKQVDSYLKPYQYKVAIYGNPRFFLFPILLRYKHKAYGMHGHGDKPYFCTYKGCERNVPGNGFPRYWNLRDHIKRVHNDLALIESKAIRYISVPDGPTKGTKRKADSTDLDEDPKSSSTLLIEINQFYKSRLLKYYY
jgi:hypothetical protein